MRSIAHEFKDGTNSKQVSFEPDGFLIEFSNTSDQDIQEFTSYLKDTGDNNLIEVLDTHLIIVRDRGQFLDKRTNFPSVKSVKITKLYSYHGIRFKRSEVYDQLIVNYRDSDEENYAKTLAKKYGRIRDFFPGYLLIEVYDNEIHLLKKQLRAKSILCEDNWQTIRSNLNTENYAIKNSFHEHRDLPKNKMYSLINYDDAEDIVVPKGNPITIGLLDNGLMFEHDDLENVNRSACKSFFKNETNQFPGDNETHGTHCAGILIGNPIQYKGIKGTGQFCKLNSYRIVRGQGKYNQIELSNFILMKAFHTALRTCDVILCSWVLPYESQLLHDVILDGIYGGKRNEKGVPIVFAAGNEGSKIHFPATLDQVISVCATDQTKYPFKNNSWETNYGPSITIAAPGIDVFTTDFVSGKGAYQIVDAQTNYIYYNHAQFWGTSAAAPLVAGTIGQMLRKNDELLLCEIKTLLAQYCTAWPSGVNTSKYGPGVLNIKETLTNIKPNL